MRIDSSGNVGIGTSSPNYLATLYKASLPILQLANSTSGSTAADGLLIYLNGANATISNEESGSLIFQTSGSERARIDSSGNLQFNSGYGSVATAYGCRAWVNFNGTGTPAIRGSGNVSSITDNGTGDYTVNFTTAMPDANYSVSGTAGDVTTNLSSSVNPKTYNTGSLQLFTGSAGGTGADRTNVNIAIFR
jgi:hypothetical protein